MPMQVYSDTQQYVFIPIALILNYVSAQLSADFLRYNISLPLPLFLYNRCLPPCIIQLIFLLRGCRMICHSRRLRLISHLGNSAGGSPGSAPGPRLLPLFVPRDAQLDLFLRTLLQSPWMRRLKSATTVLLQPGNMVFSRAIFKDLTQQTNGSGYEE